MWGGGGGGWVGLLSYVAYIGMCGPKGYGYGFFTLTLNNWVCRRNYFCLIIIDKTSNKSPSQWL